MPQRPALYRRLSARENLELFARLARVPEPEAELADLAAAVALGDALDRPVERLSLGQAQRVNVAIGLLGRPRVVLLDEPTAALDPEHRLALWAMLERVSERGGAVAFATQNVEEARLAADRVLVLVDGRAAYAGPQEAFWSEAGAVDEAGGHERAFVAFVERVAERRVSRFALLLRKDLLLLARSRPLIAVLVIYPLVLSLLVGGVLGGQGARPRVAFVNEDSIPDVVRVGDRSFDFGSIVREAGKRVELVRMSRAAGADARSRDGDVVAAIVVPRGFVSDLSSLIVSPSVLLLTNRNAYEERILRETQSFVYTLNTSVQTEYIRSNSHFLDVLVSGGKAEALGRTYDVLGLKDVQRAHRGGRGAAARRTVPRATQLESVTAFASQASAALGLAHQALASTAHPVRLVQRSTSGRSYLLGSQVQSYGLGISLAFVTLLLGAAVLTLERDENVLARLLRSGARPALLVAEKVVLCAIVGVVLGLLLALGFGVAAEISSSGAAWARIPLLVVPLAAAGAAFGALGCVVGAAARDLRASSLVGVALVTPIVLVGLVPRAVSPLAADDLGVPAVRARRARVRRDAVRRGAAHRRARGERSSACC